MPEMFTQTPLHGFINDKIAVSETRSVDIVEGALASSINIRGSVDDHNFLASCERVLGVALPIKPSTFHKTESRTVFWLGPNEWLLRASDVRAEQLEDELRQQLSGHYAIVDVSGGYTSLRLEGMGVVEVLKKSCVYDVESMLLPIEGDAHVSGSAVQTVFAKAGAIVSRHANTVYELTIRRSFADYIALWLEDASAEYGGVTRSAMSASS